MLEIYTDGSSKKTSDGVRAGGFAVIGFIDINGKKQIYSSCSNSEEGATNQKMELQAIKEGFSMATNYLYLKEDEVHIYSDSMYAINCATKWASSWSINGWKTKNGKEIANKELVEDIFNHYTRFQNPSITLEWVRGHTGEKDGNDLVDRLAQQEADRLKKELTNLKK